MHEVLIYLGIKKNIVEHLTSLQHKASMRWERVFPGKLSFWYYITSNYSRYGIVIRTGVCHFYGIYCLSFFTILTQKVLSD